MAAGPGITPTEVQLGPGELTFLKDMLESTHERRSEQPQAITAASTGPFVPAASLTKGASRNSLGEGPVFAGVPLTPGRRQAGHTAPRSQEEARQGSVFVRLAQTSAASRATHQPSQSEPGLAPGRPQGKELVRKPVFAGVAEDTAPPAASAARGGGSLPEAKQRSGSPQPRSTA